MNEFTLNDHQIEQAVLELLNDGDKVWVKAGQLKDKIWRQATGYNQASQAALAAKDAGTGQYSAMMKGWLPYPTSQANGKISNAVRRLYKAGALERRGNSTATSYAAKDRAQRQMLEVIERRKRDEANAQRAEQVAATLADLGVACEAHRSNVVIDFEVAEQLVRRLMEQS